MPLRVKVTQATGKTRHSVGTVLEGEPTPVEDVAVPDSIEISEVDGAYYLYRLDANGVCIADTWHQSLNEAKEQASFEFGIKSDEWTQAESS